MTPPQAQPPASEGVAIIGMAGRFPGARTVSEFWQNQLNAVEAISQFSVEELEVPGAQNVANNPNYVRARSILEDVDLFDADFFGVYPREAELMDPQHRLFLEICWQAFEDAGYDPFAYSGSIGVFAGCSMPTYFLSRVCADPDFLRRFTNGYQVGNYLEMLGNSQDFLSTRVSYKLNLRGPSFTLQAGCSTSLLAVSQACQSLLTYQSDMALAGGSSITFPQKRGTHYQDGGMTSPDGHCRAFDADAQGTVFGSGVAVVLLKRLDDALRDGDQIQAVIRGFAVNNDGAAKVGYTAPSIEGQAQVIAMAHAAAEVRADSIGYVEAHGTGTPLGDPIELAALTKAFRSSTSAKHFCAIGTAKTNVGHLDNAAGVTSLIHAAQVVRYGMLPPTLHFRQPNSKFDLENSPFYVNQKTSSWKHNSMPRRAGVSAFGVGGTNAHVILEQPPDSCSSSSPRPYQLLTLSARSEAALENATTDLLNHFRSHPELNLADAAWTLQVGRRRFDFRRTVVADGLTGIIEVLPQRDRKRVQTRAKPKHHAEVHFLFPGQGSQHLNMAKDVYQTERVFRETLDQCARILQPHLDTDLRSLLYPQDSNSADAERRLADTKFAQPAIFAVEYSLAQLWMSWGIQPVSMLGHSIGEFVAACIAGVFSLEDALFLIAQRGRLMHDLPPGGMLSVRLPEEQLRQRLNGTLSLAAVNAPSLCVVAGPFEALQSFEERLNSEGTACRRLATSHAFHSKMMEPIFEPFTEIVKRVPLQAPRMPYVSGVTGTWITDSEATDASYWARHFREPVYFSKALQTLRAKSADSPVGNLQNVYLEVGPGDVLTTLGRQHERASEVISISSLGNFASTQNSEINLMNALGAVWLSGVEPNWPAVHDGEKRFRVSLPTYPFERKRFWLAVPSDTAESEVQPKTAPLPAENKNEMHQEGIHVSNDSHSRSSIVAERIHTRVARISEALADIFQELSGATIPESDSSATFLEMGFDSLFLTQVTQSLQAKFALRITFRQLLGDQSTLQSLAEYLDSHLPADKFAAPTESAPPGQVTGRPDPALTSSPADSNLPQPGSSSPTPVVNAPQSGSSLERLLHEQIQSMNELFAKQLALLQGAPSVNASIQQSSTRPKSELENIITAFGEDAPASSVPQHVAANSEQNNAVELKHSAKPFNPFKPPEKGVSAELGARQKAHIDALIDRYTKRTANSKRKTQQDRGHLADPRVVSGFRAQWKEMVYPIITNRSQGSQLWDIDGNQYVDILNGFGPIMLGHRPDFVEEAIARQLHEGFEIGPQSPLAGEVARMFCEMTGNERMTFCNTGSEAVMAALRVARTVTGRSKVVLFSGAYHGMFDEVLVKAIGKSGNRHSGPVAPGIPGESVVNITVLDYGTAQSLEWIREHASELAAIITEPVQSRHPDLQPIEFLREIRQITKASGTAFIFDEVVTGFRSHPGGCQALFDIRADLATYGKVLAGGMPIGVLAGKAEFMDALDGGGWQFGDDSYPSVGVTFFAGTFVRHPLTLAAVKSVLLHFAEQGPALQERLTSRTKELVTNLNALLGAYNVPTHVEHFASIFYFSFPSTFPFGSLLHYHLREKGVYILEGFPCFLTIAHTDADISFIERAFQESLAEMQNGGLLPEPLADSQSRAGISSNGISHESAIPAQTLASSHNNEAPLTEAQMEIWLSAQLGDHASCAYNESFNLHLDGVLNTAALLSSIQELTNRHDALRATLSAGGSSQQFEEHVQLGLPVHDLSELPDSERTARMEAAIKENAVKPFDLVNGPVIRAQLLKLEANRHVLLFTSHHIVCDGWSTNILLDELAHLYTAQSTGAQLSLPSPLQFSDYARQQATAIASSESTEAEQYWLGEFAKPAPVLELPTDRPRPAVKSFSGATYRKQIDASACKRIKQAGARVGCTLFSTLLGGFASLLHRLTSQDDLIIGIPTAGQSLLDNGNLVGHAVNFLPIRVQVPQAQTAASLLGQIKRSVLDAYEHQTYTYGTLVRKLKLRRDPSRLPLVEVQFNLEKIGSDLNFSGLQAAVDPNPKSAVNFDLFLNVVESSSGLAIDCDYNSDLFDHETIARWMNHYATLLEGIAGDPSQPIDSLALLSDAEVHRVTAEWNATQQEYPIDKSVHELFQEQAARTPDAIAVTFSDKSLTYAELDHRANQIANHLIRLGVTPGMLVGICVERSLEMIVGLLGIWKAGAAYLPLDPAYPRERLAFIFEETSIPVLLTQSDLLQALPLFDTRPVCFDRDEVLIEREPATSPSVRSDANSVAYTIYTSGSSGKPKGVEVLHRNVVNLLCAMRNRPGISATDRLVAVTTLSFDIVVLELFLPLIVGAQVIIASHQATLDGRLLKQLISDSNATTMQATPATWQLLLDAGWENSPNLKMLCGGEALSRELADRLLAKGELWNMYGPTETTVWSSVSKVEPGKGPVPIGSPIQNTQFYVLDKNRHPLPIGIPGELYIGGDGVARGYYKHPDWTTERFVTNPFQSSHNPTYSAANARLYRTGDLVRYRVDGQLEFLGRLDHQVKIRGFRIELGEIEAALSRHPSVRESAVVVTEDPAGSKRLTASVVSADSQTLTAEELRTWIGKWVPAYMIPSLFVFLPALPRTPNGKLDRKTLPQLQAGNPHASEHVKPRSQTEKQLAAICQEVLHLENVSVTDNLFDLGADSLHLFQIIARASRIGLDIAPMEILQMRTISALAKALEARKSADSQRVDSPGEIVAVSRDRYRIDSVSAPA